jgi:Tfp pilus assembly protein PilN
MINLLPDDAKREIKAARTNVTLLKYIFVLAAGVAFLCVVAGGVYFILLGTQTSAESIIKDNQSKTSSYSSAQEQAQALRAGLASAKTILDKEVRYSKLITGIAKLMPQGAVLDSLSLSPATLGTPTTLTIYARSTEDALVVKNNFQTSPLFSNVTFVSISNTSQAGSYPITATLSLTINKGAAL